MLSEPALHRFLVFFKIDFRLTSISELAQKVEMGLRKGEKKGR
jgi:hypothetical protein